MNPLHLFVTRAALLLPIMALAGSPSLLTKPAIPLQGQLQIERAINGTLSEMSTGADQALVVTGTDAQSRNALIPVVGGLRPGLGAYSPIEPGTSPYATALRCLTQAIYYEAANEPEMGKLAVAQVVMNRMRHPAYPNSVCGVVYEGSNRRVCQFSFTCDGALLRTPMARQWNQSLNVAKRVLAGEQLPEVGTATHYHADYVVPKWAFTLDKLKVIGTHIFYRFPGRGGSSAAFSARWAGSERIPTIDWTRLAAEVEDEQIVAMPVEEQFVPGLTITPDVTDRHATADVGGRLDTTKEWRLSIPDPVNAKGAYDAALAGQGPIQSEEPSTRDVSQ